MDSNHLEHRYSLSVGTSARPLCALSSRTPGRFNGLRLTQSAFALLVTYARAFALACTASIASSTACVTIWFLLRNERWKRLSAL